MCIECVKSKSLILSRFACEISCVNIMGSVVLTKSRRATLIKPDLNLKHIKYKDSLFLIFCLLDELPSF